MKLRPISEPAPPSLRVASFDSRPAPLLCEETGDEDTTRFVKVVMHEPVYRDLLEGREFSPELEEGGFLVGRIFQDGSEPGCFIAEVSDAVAAEHTGATLMQLTFTGDSFGAVKRRLELDHKGKRLLGWYHTHPFPALPRLGLSSMDIQLHFTTFRISWQLAGLINLDPRVDPKDRVLRFYVRRDNTMKRCQLELTDGGN